MSMCGCGCGSGSALSVEYLHRSIFIKPLTILPVYIITCNTVLITFTVVNIIASIAYQAAALCRIVCIWALLAHHHFAWYPRILPNQQHPTHSDWQQIFFQQSVWTQRASSTVGKGLGGEWCLPNCPFWHTYHIKVPRVETNPKQHKINFDSQYLSSF